MSVADEYTFRKDFPVLAARMRAARLTIGDTRTCPDCGRPQHYTGQEYGWAHDALVDMWHCAGDRVRANKTSGRGA